MARYWVNVPGEGKPLDLSLDDLVTRQRAGKLPAGTLAVKQGSDAWAPVDSIDEVKAAMIAADEARPSNAPPSSAAQGVDLLEAPPSLGVTPQLLGGAPPPEPPKEGAQVSAVGVPPPPPPPPPPRKSGRAFFALLAVAAAILLGSGSLLCVWYKYGYTHAAVLDYVPSDCATLEYVDFAGIDDSPALAGLASKRDRSLGDWVDDLDDEDGVHKSIDDDDAHSRGATLYALKKIGLRAYGDVREFAFCEVREEGETPTTLTVVGGNFRGKDILNAMRTAILHRDKKHTEDDLKIEDVEGRSWLRLGEDIWATTPTSQIVIMGPRKLIEKHLAARPTARAYGLKDELILRHAVGDAAKGGGTEERWTFQKGKLVYVREAPAGTTLPDAAKTVLDGYKAFAERIRNLDGLGDIADGWSNADVKQEGDVMRTTITWTTSEATSVMKVLVDADLRELKPLAEALRGAVGADYFHDAIVPGVDAFSLRLAPW
jgi:hypothetical protein